MATKKAPATTPKTRSATSTASQDRKAAAMLKKMLQQLDSGIFDELCEDGKKMVIEAANLVGVDPKAFAEETEVRVDFDYAFMKLPASFTGDATKCEDYKVEMTLTHIPTGIVVKQNSDVHYVEVYG